MLKVFSWPKDFFQPLHYLLLCFCGHWMNDHKSKVFTCRKTPPRRLQNINVRAVSAVGHGTLFSFCSFLFRECKCSTSPPHPVGFISLKYGPQLSATVRKYSWFVGFHFLVSHFNNVHISPASPFCSLKTHSQEFFWRMIRHGRQCLWRYSSWLEIYGSPLSSCMTSGKIVDIYMPPQSPCL